jgi:hypothetical protein
MEARVHELGRGLSEGGAPRSARDVAADFASVLYTQVVKQMQKTMQSDEEESALAGGVRDFMSMLLPTAVSRSGNDPVAAYLEQVISRRHGGDHDTDL